MSLKKFQKKIGVTPDGVFGPNTLRAGRDYLGINNEEAAHFFGQCAHETGGFKVFSENLNYSAAGLLKTFRKYFDENTAREYQRNPIRIANRVYANRMGNGPESSGDGWKYRGRGALQTTGKTNYTLFSKKMGKPEILLNPDLVATEYAFEAAKYFFDSNGLWPICRKGVTNQVITMVTKRVNGGTNGLADRISKTNQYYGWLK